MPTGTHTAKMLVEAACPKPRADIVSWVTQPFGLRRHDFYEIPENKKEPPMRTEILIGGDERYASFMPLSKWRKHLRGLRKLLPGHG